MVNKLKVSDEDFLTCSTLSSTISITNFGITLHITTLFPSCHLIIFSLLYFFVAALSFCCHFFFFFFFAPLHFFLGALFCCHHFSCFLLPLYFIIAALFFCLLKKKSGEEWKNRQQKKYGAATYVSRSYVLPYISWGSVQLQKGIQPINLNYAFFF